MLLPKEEPRAIREAREEGRRQGLEQGKLEGRRQGALSILLPQLKRLFGVIPDELLLQIKGLSLEQLENLCYAVLAFRETENLAIENLEKWLQQNVKIKS
ncbi:MAG TPA: DUF4351 domain-containing protein [Nostocaceae cyanobacterium]|nr:DUF4351 domain-containing protein [Nostocaceae cyanobacterium]